MRMTRMMAVVAVIPAVMLLAACADEGPMSASLDGIAANRGVAEAAGARGGAPSTQSPTVVDVALAVNAESGEFSTLIAAVVTAGLVETLSANGQRTVFAPTDAAFAALGLNAGNIGTLPLDALRNILLYHVATGRRDAGSVVTSSQIRMANGKFTKISLTGEGAFINDSKIIVTDVMAGNGIIHVIDAVLLP
jgi:transforming growth factor-beta-induced protein